MAIFTNRATLTYNGGATNSNLVTGQLVEVLSVTKTAAGDSYVSGDTLAYAVSLTNSGTTPLTGLTLTDDLGSYTFGTQTPVPLSYVEGSILYFVNGVLQAAPTVSPGPPLTVSPISVPAGGNATLVYRAEVNAFAPIGEGGSVTNTVTVSGAGITDATATETVTAGSEVALSIEKSLSPTTVTETDPITYTFTVRNAGTVEAAVTENLVISDVFDPILTGLTVTYNGTTLTEGTDYTYDAATGSFATVAGVVTVPAATPVQDPATGAYSVTPGTSVLTVTGTVA